MGVDGLWGSGTKDSKVWSVWGFGFAEDGWVFAAASVACVLVSAWVVWASGIFVEMSACCSEWGLVVGGIELSCSGFSVDGILMLMLGLHVVR